MHVGKNIISKEEALHQVERTSKCQHAPLSVQRLKEEVEVISAERPWHKANLQRAKELGFEADEVILFGIESVRSIM